MSRKILILRPQPGADETGRRAREMGLHPVISPLFEIVPAAWEAPAASSFDAVLLTSANAARHGGSGTAPFLGLPCYAVGEATGGAAREAGFTDVRTGKSDGEALLRQMIRDGVGHALHLCGTDHVALEMAQGSITRRSVYAAVPATALAPEALAALRGGAVVLVHSPRAGALFAALAAQAGVDRAAIGLAAISEAAADAAGPGWSVKRIAAAPRDEALLELAVKLCKGEAFGETGSGG
ncbi:MAG TPA: uroporphyrinogen-III synthase [Allosphingosinicella sp.]|nr:uroporphyrinogen-III synthase [Allosphingosinicella sp.]